MKTIFRYTNAALIGAVIFALGVVAVSAQDPCADTEAISAMGDMVRAKYADKSIAGRTAFLEIGKQFSDKYGACESGKELSAWFTGQKARNEQLLADQIAAKAKAELLAKFDNGLKTKAFDDVYAAGKEILAKYPGEFLAVELVLGSIGYDELLDRKNAKYSDDTLKFAKQSLADLEAGKEFKPGFGVLPFKYNNKDHAIAWMNLTIGTIYQIGQKNKVVALPYLYKATQGPAGTDVSKNPNPYEFIGTYYFDELNKVVEDITKLSADQNKPNITAEELQVIVDQIKAKVAMSNGLAERAMDAFSRAYTLGQAPAYKAKMKKNVEDAHQVRFAKKEGVDAWITSAVAKPFVNPTTPVAPISDTEPAKTTTSTTTTPVTPTTMPTKSVDTSVKPATTPVAKPATTPAKPVLATKPQAVNKKAVAKKKGV